MAAPGTFWIPSISGNFTDFITLSFSSPSSSENSSSEISGAADGGADFAPGKMRGKTGVCGSGGKAVTTIRKRKSFWCFQPHYFAVESLGFGKSMVVWTSGRVSSSASCSSMIFSSMDRRVRLGIQRVYIKKEQLIGASQYFDLAIVSKPSSFSLPRIFFSTQ